MLRIVQNGPNRIDIDVSGRIDREMMTTGLDELIQQADGIEHGRLLYRIRDFEWPSFGALAVEFSRVPALFALASKFDRVAVLTDTKWVQKASEIEGALMPGLEIKAFDMDEASGAEVWLAG